MSRPISQSTQKLVDDMIKNSGLNEFQKRTLMREMRESGTLPNSVPPTTRRISAPPREVRPKPVVRYQPKRSREAIIAATDNYKEEAAPSRIGPDRDAERKDLAKKMEQDIDQKSLISHAPFVAPERTDTEPKFKNRFDEIVNEIEERKQFLEDMRKLGQGKEYEPIIESQISQLMIELEKVHKDDIKRVLDKEKDLK